ncbi:amidohydrolase family protein [Thermoproteota archaeon]
MEIVDGHTHLYHAFADSDRQKGCVEDIEGFDLKRLSSKMDELGISLLQTMPQEMSRVQGMWLGSNALSADLGWRVPNRIMAFAAAEPLDRQDVFNRSRLAEVKEYIAEGRLKGLLLTPPYGHYYANDRRVYPFYEMALELDAPVYFHHSHMFGDPKNCPLKYARIWILDDVIIDFPELRINVEHMGYPWTEELLSMMARSPNVYTDIAMFISPIGGRGRPLLLARNLGMAREYGVLERVFYGSDYVGEDLDEYAGLVKREVYHLLQKLDRDMESLGYPPLSEEELNGLLRKNVLRLLRAK